MAEMQGQKQASVDIAYGIEDGKVVIAWREPCNQIHFDPQNAFEFGEAIARTAHKARFGNDPPADINYIAQQIRLRVTEDLRDRKVVRVANMLRTMLEQNKTPGQMALLIVDQILSDIA